MGQASSADLFVQVLQTMLQLRGVRVEASQLAKFLALVRTVCPWFPSDGTINIETWKKVGDRIQGHFQAHGPDQTPVDAFALWSLIRDCLVDDSEAEKWRRLRGSLRRSQPITTLAPPADPPPPVPSLAPSSAPGPATHECAEPREEPGLESAPLVSGDKPAASQSYQTFLQELQQVPKVYPEVQRGPNPGDWDDLEEQAARYHEDDDPFAGVVTQGPGGLVSTLQEIHKELRAMADAIKNLPLSSARAGSLEGLHKDLPPGALTPTASAPPSYSPPAVQPPTIPTVVAPASSEHAPKMLRVGPPKATIDDLISPLQLALRTATREGEGIEGFTLQPYPVVEVAGPNGPQRQHEPLPYKQLKELKTACAQYGATAPFTEAVLTTLSSFALPPGDWKSIGKACLSGGDFLLWKSEFSEICSQQALNNRAHNIPITYDMLVGSGQYAELDSQLQFHPVAYEQVKQAALQAWRKLPKTGVRREELSKIRQGPDESFQDFVARLLQAVTRLVEDPEAGTILVKQLAFENANTVCQAAIRPWKGKATINDMIKLCADIGSGYVQGLNIAAAMKGVPLATIVQQQFGRGRDRGGGGWNGRRVPGPPGSCFGCGQTGHLVRNCPRGADPPGVLDRKPRPGPTEVCPRCRRGKHWASECRSQTDVQGNILTGNLSGGRPRAQKTIGVAASPSNPFTEPLQGVPDWTSPSVTM